MQARLRIACTLGLWMLGLATGCERLLSIQDPVADDGGGITDAAPGPSSPILLSEVVLTPDPGEMIEIVNTSSQAIDLSTYYLSDSGNYFRLPAQTTVDVHDFIVQFPKGALIPGHGVVTVAINTPANFSSVYARAPSYSLADGTMKPILMNDTPQLTNGGEPIILFQWDGRSDLVHDVDILFAGVPTGPTNAFPDKSHVLQDGPDPDTQRSQYAVDASTIKPQPAAPGAGFSTKRILLEDGHETHDGTGNGPSDDDETSEDTSVTWDGTTANPFTAPTPGMVPPELLR